MLNIFQDKLKECRNILKNNPNDIKARASINFIYNIIFDNNLVWFDDYLEEESNVLYLQKYLYLFKLVEEVSKKNKLAKYNVSNYKYLSKKDLLELVCDFYKNGTNKEFYELFLRMLKNKEITLYKNRKDSFDAFSIFWPYSNEFNAVIHCSNYGNNNDFNYVPIIVHEIGHGIDALINYHISFQQENYIYAEIISTFFELICNEYFYHSEFKKDSISFSYEYFNDINSKAKILNNYNIFEQYMENPINYFPYIVAFSIALELLMIYKQDKDKSLYLVKKIIEIPKFLTPEEYYKRILNLGITPNNTLDKYENILKRKLKT